jgi:hypothetical protein
MKVSSRIVATAAAAIALSAGLALAQSTEPSQSMAKPDRSPVVGMDVKGANDANLARVDNVFVSPDGQVQGLILTVGGILGIGGHQVVVAWNDVKIDQGQNEAMTDLTLDQLKSQPAYRPPPMADAGAPPRVIVPMPTSPNPASPMPGSPTTGLDKTP